MAGSHQVGLETATARWTLGGEWCYIATVAQHIILRNANCQAVFA